MLVSVQIIEPQDWMIEPETVSIMAALGAGKALFVGGCVRNTLLDLPPGDIDIATLHTPDVTMDRLNRAGIKVIPTGIDHGTVTAVIGGKHFEITTLRRDVSTDGRRAVVAFTDNWAEDAQRRDFTMNTLLADTGGNVYDPTGRGIDDLKAGRIIFVGDPAQRIAEDYLRILRFFRFHAYYGRGAPDEAALAACRAAADQIVKLSRERITQEIFRLLAIDDPALSLMFGCGVLADLPARDFDPSALARLCALQKKYDVENVMTRLVLLAGKRDRTEKYIIFSGAQKKFFDTLALLRTHSFNTSEKEIKKSIYQYNNEIVIQALLTRCNGNDESLVSRLKDWQAPVFPLGGEDIKTLGIKAGPDVGRLLRQVEQWWLDQDFAPDRAACLEKLKTIV